MRSRLCVLRTFVRLRTRVCVAQGSRTTQGHARAQAAALMVQRAYQSTVALLEQLHVRVPFFAHGSSLAAAPCRQ